MRPKPGRFVFIFLVVSLALSACNTGQAPASQTASAPVTAAAPTEKSAAAVQASIATQTSAPTETAIPWIADSATLAQAGSLCPKAKTLVYKNFSSQPLPGYLAVVKADKSTEWTPLEIGGRQAASAQELHSLVCIDESFVKCGTYDDNSTGYCRDWQVSILSFPDGKPIFQSKVSSDIPFQKIAGQGDYYAGQPMDQLFSLLDVAVLQNVVVLKPKNPGAGLISSDGNNMVMIGNDGRGSILELWDARKGRLLWSVTGSPRANFFAPVFTLDGKSVIVGTNTLPNYDREIRWYDLTNGKIVKTVKLAGNQETGIALSTDGSLLVSSEPTKISVWDTASGQVKSSIAMPEDTDSVLAALSPDNNLVAIASMTYTNNRVDIWDLSAGKMLSSIPGSAFEGDTTDRGCLFFLPDNKRLLKCSLDPADKGATTIGVWDAASGTKVVDLDFFGASVSGVAISPDQRLLLVSGVGARMNYAGQLYLYDAQTLKLVDTARAGNGEILAYGFSADSKTLWFYDLDDGIVVTHQIP